MHFKITAPIYVLITKLYNVYRRYLPPLVTTLLQSSASSTSIIVEPTLQSSTPSSTVSPSLSLISPSISYPSLTFYDILSLRRPERQVIYRLPYATTTCYDCLKLMLQENITCIILDHYKFKPLSSNTIAPSTSIAATTPSISPLPNKSIHQTELMLITLNDYLYKISFLQKSSILTPAYAIGTVLTLDNPLFGFVYPHQSVESGLEMMASLGYHHVVIIDDTISTTSIMDNSTNNKHNNKNTTSIITNSTTDNDILCPVPISSPRIPFLVYGVVSLNELVGLTKTLRIQRATAYETKRKTSTAAMMSNTPSDILK